MKARLICQAVVTIVILHSWLIPAYGVSDLYKNNANQGEAVPLPPPAQVQSLTAYPSQIKLKGSDDAQQLVLTATLAEGRVQDLSEDVKYEIADPKIARVTSAGRVIPLADGRTEITASFGPKAIKVPVTTEAINQNLPINFAN